MVDFATFGYGATVYPLTPSVANTLLKDADPALYYVLEYFQSVLTTHLEARIVAEAAKTPAIAGIAHAVTAITPYDPAPYLQETLRKFPLLAVYRVKEEHRERTSTWVHRVGEWAVQYILPSIGGAQMERVGPILQAVSAVLHNRIENTFDPSYASGAQPFALGGIERIDLVAGQYGAYEGAPGMTFPTWKGTLKVTERVTPVDGAFETLTGIDTQIDELSPNAAPVLNVADSKVDFINPTTIAGMVGLWRGDAGVVSGADASRLGSWTNQFGSAAALSPAAPSGQPYVIQAGVVVNNVPKPVVRFDGANTQLASTVAALANDSGQTLIVLFRLSDRDRRSLIVGHSQSGDTGLKTVALEANTASTVGNRFGLFANNSSFDSPAVTDLGGWHVGVLRTANTTAGGSITTATTYRLDGTTQPLTLRSGAGTWSSMAAADQLIVGGNVNALAATAAACDIGVVMAFSSALSTTDTATAVAYCKQWAGLT